MKSINLFEEIKKKPIRVIKKGRIKTYDSFFEVNHIPFDNVDDIHQEPGMILDKDLQQELDKLLE